MAIKRARKQQRDTPLDALTRMARLERPEPEGGGGGGGSPRALAPMDVGLLSDKIYTERMRKAAQPSPRRDHHHPVAPCERAAERPPRLGAASPAVVSPRIAKLRSLQQQQHERDAESQGVISVRRDAKHQSQHSRQSSSPRPGWRPQGFM